MTERLRVRHGGSQSKDEATAVAELHAQIHQEDASVALVYCSVAYDLVKLARALRETFSVPIIACTTAGQIGSEGFQVGGLNGASLASDELHVQTYAIQPLSECHTQAVALGQRVAADRASRAPGSRAFSLLLADGNSHLEERLAAALSQALGEIAIVGGSAGDDLTFKRTYVYVDGEFVSKAAVVGIFETTLPFAPFKFHHFEATEQKLVITRADPERRIVYEIDGEPAAQAYADLVGVPLESLDFTVFSAKPMLLQIGNEQYVRTIVRAEPDGSLLLGCAIDEGLVLSLGRAMDPMLALDRAFAAAAASTRGTKVVLGFDCIFRRLEFEASGLASRVGAFFAEQHVVGFSSYGEQTNAIHVNQTFTGIAIGG